MGRGLHQQLQRRVQLRAQIDACRPAGNATSRPQPLKLYRPLCRLRRSSTRTVAWALVTIAMGRRSPGTSGASEMTSGGSLLATREEQRAAVGDFDQVLERRSRIGERPALP